MQKHYMPIWPINPKRALRERDKFGAYRHGGRRHAGIDIYNDKGTDVKASLDGKVVRATGDGGHEKYGGLVIIDHTPEIPNRRDGRDSDLLCYVYTLYGHLNKAIAGLGSKVRQGDTIGTVGNTGNAKTMDPHLHFETIRAPKKLTWNPTGNTGIKAGLYRMNPLDFLGGFSLPEECFEPLTDREMDKLYGMIKTDMRLGSKPALLVNLPDYKEFIRKERGEYPDPDEKPPKVKLKFENNFGKEFREFFPTLELEVNGRSLGRVQTGTKTYELDIWR